MSTNWTDKMELRDIMTTELVTVEPEATLREVAETLAAWGVTGLPVVQSDGRIVGVISKSDLIEFIATTPPVTLDPAFEQEAEDFLLGIKPDITDEESGAYYTQLWPDAETDVVERFAQPHSAEFDLLTQYTASSIMTRKLETLPPDAEIKHAARRLLNRGIHRILVVDNERLQGIVSTTDIVRVMAIA